MFCGYVSMHVVWLPESACWYVLWLPEYTCSVVTRVCMLCGYLSMHVLCCMVN